MSGFKTSPEKFIRQAENALKLASTLETTPTLQRLQDSLKSQVTNLEEASQLLKKYQGEPVKGSDADELKTDYDKVFKTSTSAFAELNALIPQVFSISREDLDQENERYHRLSTYGYILFGIGFILTIVGKTLGLKGASAGE